MRYRISLQVGGKQFISFLFYGGKYDLRCEFDIPLYSSVWHFEQENIVAWIVQKIDASW